MKRVAASMSHVACHSPSSASVRRSSNTRAASPMPGSPYAPPPPYGAPEGLRFEPPARPEPVTPPALAGTVELPGPTAARLSTLLVTPTPPPALAAGPPPSNGVPLAVSDRPSCHAELRPWGLGRHSLCAKRQSFGRASLPRYPPLLLSPQFASVFCTSSTKYGFPTVMP